MFDRADDDMLRAINEVYEGDYYIDEFDIQRTPNLPVDDAINMAVAYAPFLDPGVLEDLADEDADAVLMQNDRTEEWCDRAKAWARTGIPAIVFVDISVGGNPSYQLADGQHRLAYASAKGLETIDAIIMRRRR